MKSLQELIYEGINLKTKWPEDLRKAIETSEPCEYDDTLGYRFYGCENIVTKLNNYGRASKAELKSSSKKTDSILFSSGNEVMWYGPKSGPAANTQINIRCGANKRRGFINLYKYSSDASRNRSIDNNLDYLLSGVVIPADQYEAIWDYLTGELAFKTYTPK